MGDHEAQLKQVLYAADDVAAAAEYYGAVFGFATKFVDGDRYAALDAGGTTLALAGPAEDITEGRAAAAVKVVDLAATLQDVVAAGGTVIREPEQGPHEVRAVVRDPWGNILVVYASV